MVTTLPHLGRTVARPLGVVMLIASRRSVRRVVGLVLVVAVVRASAGVWAAALLGAVVLTVGLLAGWAAVERRVTDRVRSRPSAAVVERGPRGPARLDGEHVAFARGLAGLASWYLAECEREAQR